MTEFLFILGASDPEMSAIERLLAECRIPFAYATVDGVRVHPGNAYRADDCSVSCGEFLYSESRVFVECRPASSMMLMQGDSDTFIDHHNPGDPGYGLPPERLLEGSSIGQVICFLAKALPHNAAMSLWKTEQKVWGCPAGSIVRLNGDHIVTRESPAPPLVIPADLVLIAAADHCLAAAYAGKCPGVNPAALAAWRVKSRSEFQRRTCPTCNGQFHCDRCGWSNMTADGSHCSHCTPVCPECSESAIAAKIETAKAALLATLQTVPLINLHSDLSAVDMRGQHVSELPEAASQLGICFVADVLPCPDGRVKVVCQSGTPDQIDAFMRYWVPSQGLVGVYGDPERGFAGAYLPTPVPA